MRTEVGFVMLLLSVSHSINASGSQYSVQSFINGDAEAVAEGGTFGLTSLNTPQYPSENNATGSEFGGNIGFFDVIASEISEGVAIVSASSSILALIMLAFFMFMYYYTEKMKVGE